MKDPPVCRIQYALGRIEDCPGTPCPLWDDAAGCCVVTELRLDVERSPELAGYLLQLRGRLEQATDGAA